MGRNRKGVDRLAKSARYRDIQSKIGGLPVVSSLIKRILVARGTSFTIIPVHKEVELPGGTAMPISVVEHFVKEAACRVILDYCICRFAQTCKNYPIGHGCLFIGEGAREIESSVGRRVGIDEAVDHLREGIELGLVTVLGRIDIDAMILGVKKADRLMTICQCCPCCCLTASLHYASKGVRDIIVRLEGVEVNVTEDCTGCGACVDACIFKQMRVIDGRAVIGEECKGCGRCAVACKTGAIKITLNDSNYVNACIERIREHVDVSPVEGRVT
jgi:ferredoxin